jgi:ABC-2 type transport system permease protein
MRGTLTIAWRDFRALVTTPLFYIVAGCCAFIWGMWFPSFLDQFSKQNQHMMGMEGTGNVHSSVFAFHISLVNLLLLFAIPAISMKFFTEDKKLNTFDLLLTAPVTSTHIVMGKFLAGVAAVWILVLVSLVHPLSVWFGGVSEIPWGPLFSAYFGLLLLTASYVAIGIFASSLTNSILLAVILGFIFNLMFWFVGSATEMTDSPRLIAIFEYLNVGEHFFKGFVKGTIKMTSIVFFLSVIGLNCFLTQRVVESARWR